MGARARFEHPLAAAAFGVSRQHGSYHGGHISRSETLIFCLDVEVLSSTGLGAISCVLHLLSSRVSAKFCDRASSSLLSCHMLRGRRGPAGRGRDK